MTTDIRNIAINLARTRGLINLTRAELCTAAGIPDGSFQHVTGCSFTDFIEQLRRDPSVASAAGPVTRTRTNPELRRDHILGAAVTVARRDGYRGATLARIAEEAGVSHSLVSRYFHTINQLRRAIMRQAVQDGIPEIVAQGLADRHPEAIKAPEELKQRAAAVLTGV